ncbi:hypothetical protein J1785_15670, partial [Rahnella sp. SL6]|nr:hypothetical protein [Rahnella perminowiae]
MLNLSNAPQSRHQERASQFGDQLFKSLPLTAKRPFHFTVKMVFSSDPVNQFYALSFKEEKSTYM